MPTSLTSYTHVNYLWDDRIAESLSPAERLIYRSNLLGSDQRITNTGGGNTSSKLIEKDPLTGEETEVLWVKGSGGDLRTSRLENFSSLYQSKLLDLQKLYARQEPKGVKTEAEDRMVGLYSHCTFNLNPRATSIDTPLHSFIPAKCVDHTHPNAVIAVAAAKNSRELTKKIYGEEVGWIEWIRPGFELGLSLQAMCRENPRMKGIILGQHGLINWADSDKECYELSLRLIEKAAQYIEEHDRGAKTFGGSKYAPLAESERERVLCDLLPWLRGQLSGSSRFFATIQSDEVLLRFVGSRDAARLAELGTSCPDHFLRTKIKPLYIDWDPSGGNVEILKSGLIERLKQYRADYAAYYQAHKHPDSPAMRDPNPTVILIPGVGMIAWGKSKSESRVTAEFFNCAVEVIRGSESIDEYVGLPQQEAFDIEYWLLEEAKLRRMPAEKDLARRIVVVVGAGSGIGKSVTEKLARAGAHIVCADRNGVAAADAAEALRKEHGAGIGVAGTGISSCGPAVGLEVDVTNRDSVRAMFKQVLLAYGGVDDVVVTAGLYLTPDNSGRLPDEEWKRTFDVNVLGGFVVADEARPIWNAQQLSGTLVLTTSVNAVVAKKGSAAYDCSKAAANHLARTLAIELAPLVRVNALAPATVLEGSSMFHRERFISSLSKYGIAYDESEDTAALCEKLAQFYAQRTLTKRTVRPQDQADAVYFLISERSSKITGQIISVDGGLQEAFLR